VEWLGRVSEFQLFSLFSGTPGATMALNATMRALLWHGIVGNISVTTVPKPTIESASDALIRIRVAGICGSDLHTYRGFSGPNDVPWSIGHEGLGVIEAVGKAVKSHKVGDYVVIPDGVDDGHIKSSGKIERPIILGTGLGHDGCQGKCRVMSCSTFTTNVSHQRNTFGCHMLMST
jgi:threonine dehydrogenase-like Zn-dependent dehydrogenase